MADQIFVNNYYALPYLTLTDLNQFRPSARNEFWSSLELMPTAADLLTLDLGRIRPVTFIDFEICKKPIDIAIEYDDNGTFREVEYRTDVPVNLSINYSESLYNPWLYFRAHFSLVQTRYIRLSFTRRSEPFPFSDSPLFPWSIDVRNLRVVHVISAANDFVADSGLDILGNEFETSVEIYEAEDVVDGLPDTYWMSQPNPVSEAVEAVYFDLRSNPITVDMAYLNVRRMKNIEGHSMANLATTYRDGVVIDEIYLDPVTHGCSMHIYHSTDDEADWDSKLWVPVLRHYTLKKGFHALPYPTYAKYVKLEFTNLAPMPYNTLDHPDTPPVTFRRFPTWVQQYFEEVFPFKLSPDRFQPLFSNVTVDPIRLAFERQDDFYDSGFAAIAREPSDVETATEAVRAFILETVEERERAESKAKLEEEVSFQPPTMFQGDLRNNLNLNRALSRKVIEAPDDQWLSEEAIERLDAPAAQSLPDLTKAREQKERPVMWFPRTCRHGYQVLEGEYRDKLAYFVGLREVSFHRKDYTVEKDEPWYVVMLNDLGHIALNEFVASDNYYEAGSPTVSNHKHDLRITGMASSMRATDLRITGV